MNNRQVQLVVVCSLVSFRRLDDGFSVIRENNWFEYFNVNARVCNADVVRNKSYKLVRFTTKLELGVVNGVGWARGDPLGILYIE